MSLDLAQYQAREGMLDRQDRLFQGFLGCGGPPAWMWMLLTRSAGR